MRKPKLKAIVKEGTASAFLALEPLEAQANFPQGLIMELTPGTTYDEAAELANTLNRIMVNIAPC